MSILKLTTPLMRGTDVREFQRGLNHWLGYWHVDLRVAVDGQFGPRTESIGQTVLYGLGVDHAEYAHGVTPRAQTILHHPKRRTKAAHARYRARAEWRRRLRKRFELHGAALAVAYAKKMAALHIVEHPAGSNRGPYIDTWNRAVGTPPGPMAYWCGAFANSCLVAAGFHNQHFMAYCPYIVNTAKAGQHGWSWHSLADARVGDLALYAERGVAGHVEIIVDTAPFTTVGGNTSADASPGSQSNGGGVFLRHRDPHYSGFPVMGIARPPYSHP